MWKVQMVIYIMLNKKPKVLLMMFSKYLKKDITTLMVSNNSLIY